MLVCQCQSMSQATGAVIPVEQVESLLLQEVLPGEPPIVLGQIGQAGALQRYRPEAGLFFRKELATVLPAHADMATEQMRVTVGKLRQAGVG